VGVWSAEWGGCSTAIEGGSSRRHGNSGVVHVGLVVGGQFDRGVGDGRRCGPGGGVRLWLWSLDRDGIGAVGVVLIERGNMWVAVGEEIGLKSGVCGLSGSLIWGIYPCGPFGCAQRRRGLASSTVWPVEYQAGGRHAPHGLVCWRCLFDGKWRRGSQAGRSGGGCWEARRSAWEGGDGFGCDFGRLLWRGAYDRGGLVVTVPRKYRCLYGALRCRVVLF